jgi:multidrug efflux pump subunit AcrA (membrane-fusion protein)
MKALGVMLGVLVLCAIVAAIGWTLRSRPTDVVAAPTAPSVATEPARFGTFVERVAAHGRVGAPAGTDAKLAFAGSGILTRIDVRVGAAVSAGQPLAEYGGSSVTRSQLAAAQARVEASLSKLTALERGAGSVQSDRTAAETALRQCEAKVALDAQTLAREQELLRGGVAARKDVDAAGEQLALDRADEHANRARLQAASAGIDDALAQARADYRTAVSDADVAARDLGNATLYAPSDGIVVAVLKHVGESVDPATPVVAVGPALSHSLTLTIPGRDGRRVEVGDRVDFNATARGGHGSGRVAGVVPSVDPTTQTTTAVVDGVPPDLAGGDAVDATITVGERRGIIVPTGAVVQDPQSGDTLVFVRERRPDGSLFFRPQRVRVADGDDRWSLIESGLRANQRVATEGAFDLLAPSGGG